MQQSQQAAGRKFTQKFNIRRLVEKIFPTLLQLGLCQAIAVFVGEPGPFPANWWMLHLLGPSCISWWPHFIAVSLLSSFSSPSFRLDVRKHCDRNYTLWSQETKLHTHDLSDNWCFKCIFYSNACTLMLMLADMSGQLGKVVTSARTTFMEGRSR